MYISLEHPTPCLQYALLYIIDVYISIAMAKIILFLTNCSNRGKTHDERSSREDGMFFFRSIQMEEVSSLPPAGFVRHPPPTLYVANQGVTMKLRFGGKAVPT